MHDALVPRVALGAVPADRLHERVDLVGLEEHHRREVHSVLEAFAAGEAVRDRAGDAGAREDPLVHLAREVLARAGVGQPQEVDRGAVVLRIADLPARQRGLQRQRPAERQDRLGVGRVGERVVDDFVDEPRHAQERRRHGAGIDRRRRRQFGLRGFDLEGGQIDIAGGRFRAESLAPQRSGGRREVTVVLEQRVHGEERVPAPVLEGRGVGREHIEHAAFERGTAAPVLAGAGPVLVLAPAHPSPAVLDQ